MPGHYPSCIYYSFTGLYCPGCGTTRGIYAILHLHFLRALDHNPLLVLSLPFFAHSWWWMSLRVWGKPRPPRPRLDYRWILALFVLIVAFWVARNLPWWPWTILAP